MKTMTPRQRTLHLIAKLYELAAEFTGGELQDICNEQSRQPKSAAIQAAIKALIQLHEEMEGGARPGALREVNAASAARETLPVSEASSLAELLNDRRSFATVAEIADAIQIEARPKESRERYISRVSRLLGTMDSRDREIFLNKIGARLNTRPESFFSNWSKLIREM